MKMKFTVSDLTMSLIERGSNYTCSQLEKEVKKYKGYSPCRNGETLESPKAQECIQKMQDYADAILLMWVKKYLSKEHTEYLCREDFEEDSSDISFESARAPARPQDILEYTHFMRTTLATGKK